eukprot:g77228.t1
MCKLKSFYTSINQLMKMHILHSICSEILHPESTITFRGGPSKVNPFPQPARKVRCQAAYISALPIFELKILFFPFHPKKTHFWESKCKRCRCGECGVAAVKCALATCS